MAARQIVAAPVSAVAAHEAAHAVVATHLSEPIELVTIVQEGDMAGHARFASPGLDAPLGTEVDALIRRAVVFAAGRAGEKLFGFIGSDVSLPPRDDDSQLAACVAVVAFDDAEREAMTAWICARADAIVAKLGPEIATVAKHLDQRKTLHRDELLRLLPSITADRSPIALRAFVIRDAVAASAS